MTLLLFLCLFVFTAFSTYAEDRKSEDDKDEDKTAEEVVVTGTRIKTDLQDLPADVTVIDQGRLRQPGVKNSLDALIDISGVNVNPRQDNGTFSSVDVRGLRSELTSGGSLLVLLDGIPQRRLSFGGPYMGALPYDAVYRMEMAKGSTASLYGRNALAGALQLFTDPGSTTNHFDILTAFEYPAVSTRASLKGSGPIGRNMPHTYSMTGSITKSQGWQEDNRLLRGDLYAHMDFRPSPQDLLTVIGGFYSSKEENVAPVLLDEDGKRLKGIDRDTNLGVDGFNNLTLTEYRTGGIWTHNFGKWLETKLTGAYWHGDTYYLNGVGGMAPTEGTVMSRLSTDLTFDEDNYFSELDLTFNYHVGSWLKGSAIIGGSYEYLTYRMIRYGITTTDYVADDGTVDFSVGIPLDLSTFDEPPRSTWVYSDKTQRDTFELDSGVFVRDQTDFFDRVHLTGGVRYDRYDRTQLDPVTREKAKSGDNAASPSAGLGFSIIKNEQNRLNLYGAWGMGYSPIFRAVTNTQFADIDPERSRSAEAGIKSSWIKQMVTLNVVGYQMERMDIVDLNPENNMFENIGDWRIKGLEAEAEIRPIKQLLFFANFTWRDPVITRYEVNTELEENQIAGMSKQQGAAGVKAKADFGLGGGTSARYFSETYTNPDNTCELQPYVLWDAYLSYAYKDHAEFSVFAKNLLDTEYMSAVYGNVGYQSGFEGTPRTFGAQVRAHF